jgi:hypothetical protein
MPDCISTMLKEISFVIAKILLCIVQA